MSDRHRGTPQIHINSAESKTRPSNVEQSLRWDLLHELRILEVEKRWVGCRASEAGWKPRKGTLDRAKGGQPSAVPASDPLGPDDRVPKKDVCWMMSLPLRVCHLLAYLTLFPAVGKAPEEKNNLQWI